MSPAQPRPPFTSAPAEQTPDGRTHSLWEPAGPALEREEARSPETLRCPFSSPLSVPRPHPGAEQPWDFLAIRGGHCPRPVALPVYALPARCLRPRRAAKALCTAHLPARPACSPGAPPAPPSAVLGEGRLWGPVLMPGP